MKQFWLGLVLLLGLPVLSFGVQKYTEHIQTPISDLLDQAAEEVLSGDWEAGTRLGSQAQEAWTASRSMAAAVSNHTALERIDGLFARMDAYRRSGSVEEYSAACRELSTLTEAATDAQKLTWWNLL